jgi:phage/plasmid-like protein (TIGR03299 family)
MIKKAGLTWSVEALEVKLPNGEAVTNFRALVRRNALNELDVFGPCGPRYVPVQNSEAFAFFKEFTSVSEMQLEVAGSLKGGRYVWALARFNEELNLDGDVSRNYVLLVSPHIWGQSLKILYTPVRVVCMNTMTQALNASAALEQFRHIHDSRFDKYAISRAKDVLSLATVLSHEYADAAKLLAKIQVSERQASMFFARLFKPAVETGTEKELVTDVTVGHWLHVLGTNPGHDLPAAKGTAWGLVNAVTYGLDHLAGAREDNRLFSAWLGPNARKKQEAFKLALSIPA